MKQFSNSKILSVETSCDDTCISIIKIKNLPRTEPEVLVRGQKSPKQSLRDATGQAKIKNFDILSNIISSQIEIHKKWGGVYPTLAKREHQRNLLPVLIRALRQSKLLKISKSKFLWTRSGLPVGLLSKQILNGAQPNAGRAAGGLESKFQKLKKILEREKNLFKYLKNFLINYRKPKVDLIAVTVGPGLEPCLWVGVNFAKAIAYFWNLPIVPVNHIEAHILANFIGENSQFLWTPGGGLPGGLLPNFQKIFPAVCLVVSGGHTQLILMKDFGKYKILGQTRDDAAGECFDKTAKILGLEYPGGPSIAEQARQWKLQFPWMPGGGLPEGLIPNFQTNSKFQILNSKFSIKLPRPMIYSKDYDFSFSGLKTAVLYKAKSEKRKAKSEKYIQKMCKEIQQAIIDVLIKKTIKAAKDFKARTIILGGGVAANKELRRQFKQRLKKEIPNSYFLIPKPKLCTDNAAMVAVAGYFSWLQGKKQKWQKIKAEANLRIE